MDETKKIDLACGLDGMFYLKGKIDTSIKQMLLHQSWEDGLMYPHKNWMN
jgi:hypothetical protein